MLPPSHVAYTIAAVEALKERFPHLQTIDYRFLALAAIAPDLIDKPFAAAYFYRRYGSAVLFAHTCIVHLSLLLYTLWKRPGWWPYAAAFNGHAILDRLWFFKHTWLWPFAGWRFTVWQRPDNQQESLEQAYWQAFTRRPDLIRWEVGGLLCLLWFVIRHKLYRPQRLIHLLITGRPPP